MRKKIIIILSVIISIILIGLLFYLSQKTDNKKVNNNLHQKTKEPIICQQINQGLLTKNINDIAMANDGELYVATDIGIFKSIDNGVTWWAINNGLTISGNTPDVKKIIIHDNKTIKYDNIVIYALADGHIFKSINKGIDWKKLSRPEKGIVIDFDISQSYSCGKSKNCGDLYVLTLVFDSNNMVDLGDIKMPKRVYYLNHFNINHWESKLIKIDFEPGTFVKQLSITDRNIFYLLTEFPNNLYHSFNNGDRWEKNMIEREISHSIVNLYSTFTDSIPADGDADPISVLVQNTHNNSTLLYEITKSYTKLYPELSPIVKEKLKYKTIKVGKSYLNIILYYPYIEDQIMINQDKYFANNFHYNIPNNFQATYHKFLDPKLDSTFFVASDEGVFSCDLK